MGLRWEQAHWGGGWHGFDGGFFAAQVVPYDRTELVVGGDGMGRDVKLGVYWRAYLAGDPVDDVRYETAEEAKTAADRAHDTRG